MRCHAKGIINSLKCILNWWHCWFNVLCTTMYITALTAKNRWSDPNQASKQASEIEWLKLSINCIEQMVNDAFIVNSNCSFDFRIYTTSTNFRSILILLYSLSLLNVMHFASLISFSSICDRNLSFLTVHISFSFILTVLLLLLMVFFPLITCFWTNRHTYLFPSMFSQFSPSYSLRYKCLSSL